MRAAVTGANGHLGSTLCSQLSEVGVDVRACLRSPHNSSRIPSGAARLAECDLSSAESLAQSFEGCDVVFHTAAPSKLFSRKASDIELPIYEGTLNVIRASAQARVRTIIYTSSCAAIGFHAPQGALLNEDNYNESTKHPQFRAKVKSERDGRELALSLGIKLIRVCVPSILGPGFRSLTPSVEPYVQLVRGRLPFVPDLDYSVLDVRDLAAAQIILALAEPRHNRYIVAGNQATTSELLKVIGSIERGLRVPKVLPAWALPGLALLDGLVHTLTLGRSERKLTLTLARECAGARQRLSDARFRSEFPQWQARPLLVTLRDTLSWVKNAYA